MKTVISLVFAACHVFAQSPQTYWGFTSPPPGSIGLLYGASAVFTWAPYPQSASYLFEVGSTPGGSDYARAVTTSTSWSFSLPYYADESGLPVYARVQAFSAATPLAADSAIYFTSAPGCTGSTSEWCSRNDGLRFVPRQPCRAVDTRLPLGSNGDPALGRGETRDFDIRQGCGIPESAWAISANVTVVPEGPLGYLTLSESRRPRPFVSTLNSTDGRIRSNAAILSPVVAAYATDRTHVILDINGYFEPPGFASPANRQYLFHAVTPCRVMDTRIGGIGGSTLDAQATRDVTVSSNSCGVPSYAQAYSLTVTAIPSGPLGYLTVWPAETSRPLVSTLNSPTGTVVANAAIVRAGSRGAISIFATNRSDVVIDINGYFAAPEYPGGLSYFPATPCRISDTRDPQGLFGGPQMQAGQTRDYMLPASKCAPPTLAKAFVLNTTVVPAGPLAYLALFAAGTALPFASNLNALDGSVTPSAAIVQGNASAIISAFTTNRTDLILDYFGYFAP